MNKYNNFDKLGCVTITSQTRGVLGITTMRLIALKQ